MRISENRPWRLSKKALFRQPEGFYYQKPIPWEKILAKYESGVQIGFENPAESAYYEAVGRINLYDLSVISQGEKDAFHNFFNTLPVAVLEVKGKRAAFAQSNKAFRDFMERFFGIRLTEMENADYIAAPPGIGPEFMSMVRQCCQNGNRAFISDQLADGFTVHTFIRRLAVNPVSGAAAVVLVILSVADASKGTNYADIARALASDYFNLFYVNLETETYTEYRSEPGREDMTLERHGDNFFAQSRGEAVNRLVPEDQAAFIAAFTKENIIRELEENGTFSITYRQLMEGKPVYVGMKVRRMRGDYVVMGVRSQEAQMWQKAKLDKLRDNQIACRRIAAISEILALYAVDPGTGEYEEYCASDDYRGLNLPHAGAAFFRSARENAPSVLHPDDLPHCSERMTRENVLREIREKGVFTLRCRLMMKGGPTPVVLKAALVRESDGEKLILGVKADDRT